MNTSRLRAASFAALALAALSLSFAREPFALALPEPGWLAPPTAARSFGVLRAFAGLALLNLAAWGLGTGCIRALPMPGARGPAQLGFGFAVLSVAVLALAASHALSPLWIGALLALGCGVGAYDALGRERTQPRHAWAWLGAGVTLLASPALAAFGPDPGWDALTYHLAVPERYTFANGIVVTPWSVFSAFPHATAMLYLLAETLDGPALARLLHLEFGVLTGIVAWRAARATSPRAAWLAAAALAACPLYAWELSVAYADLSACFYTLLAALAFTAPRGERDWRRFVAAGVFAGAAAACRYPSWPLLPVLGLCLWLPGSPAGAGVRARALASLAFGGAALAVLAPWLLRNLVFTGNPVAPLAQRWFAAPGSEFFAPTALAQNASLLRAIGPGRGFLELLALPWNLTFEASVGDYRAFGFRIGVLFALGAAAGLLAGRAGRPAQARSLWLVAGLLTLCWFFTTQEPRYLLPALVLVAVAGASAADALLPQGRLGRPWLALPLLAVLHTQLPIASALPERYGLALGGLEAAVPAAARAGAKLREMLESGDRLVVFFEPRGYFFRGLDYVPYHLGSGSPLLVALHAAAERDALPELFSALGASHVLLETQLRPVTTPRFTPDYSREDFVSDLRALERHLERRAFRVLEEGSIVVYRLRSPR